MGALAGRTVVVTRAAEQADALADVLRERGALPVVVPLVEIVAVPAEQAALAALRADTFDWLVASSPNAATAYLAAHAEHPRHAAAVGEATAQVLRAGGVAVELVPHRQRAAGLVEAFPDGPGRVLVVQGSQAESGLVDGLTARGWSVTVARPFTTAPVRPPEDLARQALAADAVLFASGSAARAWVEVFGSAAPPIVVAIGPQTADAVTRAGLKVSSTATDHSLAGLADALERQLARR